MGLKLAIAKLNDLMAEREFPLQSLEQAIHNLEQQHMEDNLTTSKAGNELAESPLDEVARTAKCDIILELSWEVKDLGPKHSLSYILEGRDAYTAKSIGASAGTGAPSFSADVDVLLEEAIVANMDNFNNRLMDHFTEMQTIGREISLDIKVFANNEAGIDLETEFDGDELIDIINNWLQVNTVQGRFSMPYASENVANFTQVRIPVYDSSRAMRRLPSAWICDWRLWARVACCAETSASLTRPACLRSRTCSSNWPSWETCSAATRSSSRL